MIQSQWYGKKVAFLGDSITDPGTWEVTKFWHVLCKELGIIPLVYGIKGMSWKQGLEQAEKLYAEHCDDVDAIFILFGSNDYNSAREIGDWFTTREETIIGKGGVEIQKTRRIPAFDNNTLCGTINNLMFFVKEHFPKQQIIIMTPPHRGYAKFSETNIQPDEVYPNNINLFFEKYISIIREAGDYWSVPVIDLYRECGLLPRTLSHGCYFRPYFPDWLHPNNEGHKRIAKVIQYKILGMPSDFK